jgi:hypothetical protein
MIIDNYMTQNPGNVPKDLAIGIQESHFSAQAVDLKAENRFILITLSDIYGGKRK